MRVPFAIAALCLAPLCALAQEGTGGLVPRGASLGDVRKAGELYPPRHGVVIARYIRTLDGDTFTAEVYPMPGEERAEVIRITPIAAPELTAKCWRERGLAQQAKAKLEGLLTEGEPEKEEERLFTLHWRGRNLDRILARVIRPDGVDVGEEMLKSGLAVAYPGKPDWCSG